jgi:hypothetical protein
MLRQGAKYLFLAGSLITIALGLAGCPPDPGENNGTGDGGHPQGNAKVTVLLGSDPLSLSGALLKAIQPNHVVAAEEIYSLTVTVTEITLQPEDNDEGEGEGDDDHQGDDDHDGDDDQDGDDDSIGDDDSDHETDSVNGAKSDDHGVVVFTGAIDVDLLSLGDVSMILTTAGIPAGVYEKIRISITDPRLVLISDPGTVFTDIHLTANGHLFVGGEFEIPDGNSLIELTFAGIHLVRTGHGSYVLTPQLRADVFIGSADVTLAGTIASVDTATQSMVVTLAEGDVTVLYGSAAIFLPGDTDTPTGSEADLVTGASVEIEGTVDLDGVVTATTIHILL